MSSQDIQAVAEIINGILNPDNAMRNASVEKLESLRENTPHLILCLFKIMKGISIGFSINKIIFNFLLVCLFNIR